MHLVMRWMDGKWFWGKNNKKPRTTTTRTWTPKWFQMNGTKCTIYWWFVLPSLLMIINMNFPFTNSHWKDGAFSSILGIIWRGVYWRRRTEIHAMCVRPLLAGDYMSFSLNFRKYFPLLRRLLRRDMKLWFRHFI